MSENIENTLSPYEKAILNLAFQLCSNCNQPNTGYNWCLNCNTKIFQQEFSKWTSGNEHLNKFIQDAQLKARNEHEVIEWIPYNRLRNIQYFGKGGFSVIYKAIWLDGKIYSWDNENKQWNRYSYSLKTKDYENAKNKLPLDENEADGCHVVLKSLNNSSNINEEILNEVNTIYYNLFICK